MVPMNREVGRGMTTRDALRNEMVLTDELHRKMGATTIAASPKPMTWALVGLLASATWLGACVRSGDERGASQNVDPCSRRASDGGCLERPDGSSGGRSATKSAADGADAGAQRCPPGTAWFDEGRRCVTLEYGQQRLPPCRFGRIETGGHCCWPGQDWGVESQRCVGDPRCPSGFQEVSKGCVEIAQPVRVSAPGQWVVVPAGAFTMGAPPLEEQYDGVVVHCGDEEDTPEHYLEDRDPNGGGAEAEHEVTLTRAFMIQTTEVTQKLFHDAMGYDPSYFSKCGAECPVERVSWHEAAAYCNRLSEIEGLRTCYRCSGKERSLTCVATSGSPYECPGYRLPTEAEWEYAARAGTNDSRYGEVDDVAWYEGNSERRTHPVKQKQKNRWGLYDTLGNVGEWCHDWHRDYPGCGVKHRGCAASDPVTERGTHHLSRGGDSYSQSYKIRAARREAHSQTQSRHEVLGVRPVRSVTKAMTKTGSDSERSGSCPPGTAWFVAGLRCVPREAQSEASSNPSTEPEPEPVEAVDCPSGQIATAGRCCWPGQDWGLGSKRCIGKAMCPRGFAAQGEGCQLSCLGHKVHTDGHCCWPGQNWSESSNECRGRPRCSKGLQTLATSCVGRAGESSSSQRLENGSEFRPEFSRWGRPTMSSVDVASRDSTT